MRATSQGDDTGLHRLADLFLIYVKYQIQEKYMPELCKTTQGEGGG
jgi:hypothetical protein